jgi:hypothetical protein
VHFIKKFTVKNVICIVCYYCLYTGTRYLCENTINVTHLQLKMKNFNYLFIKLFFFLLCKHRTYFSDIEHRNQLMDFEWNVLCSAHIMELNTPHCWTVREYTWWYQYNIRSQRVLRARDLPRAGTSFCEALCSNKLLCLCLATRTGSPR